MCFTNSTNSSSARAFPLFLKVRFCLLRQYCLSECCARTKAELALIIQKNGRTFGNGEFVDAAPIAEVLGVFSPGDKRAMLADFVDHLHVGSNVWISAICLIQVACIQPGSISTAFRP